nr:HAD-IIIC family phosphatase [Otoolea muris]
MFDSPELTAFCPDLIYIHTSTRNINAFPVVKNTEEEIDALLEETYAPFEAMWQKIETVYHCPVIQNNFEPPHYRLLGNRDAWDPHGRLHFVKRLNARFCAYAAAHENFYLQDISYLASCYGLDKWSDPFYWHMYKYACAVPAIPALCFNLANIVKSIFGRNKKALVLDLDNTLWGGVVGDDGPEGIEIGQETSAGQLYSEFQAYIKAHKDIGILLAVDSKNEEENALAGLRRPDSVLKPEDFLVIRANWEPKDENLRRIAEELNIGTDSLVFVDDNPAERHRVRTGAPETAVPELGPPETYIRILDRSGFFEATGFSQDDIKRNAMYEANAARKKQEAGFDNYEEYLRSLEMRAEIRPFSPLYMARIAQLTNKSNQFNLTTRRHSQAEMEEKAADPGCITLYGKLEDRFGNNGVVSVVYGHFGKGEAEDIGPKSDREAAGGGKTGIAAREEKDSAAAGEGNPHGGAESFHIDLWLMSCRVLKRGMEFAMMDALVKECLERDAREVFGYYYPTAKNRMVKDFYALQGFDKILEDEAGNSVWRLDLCGGYETKNHVIKVEEKQDEDDKGKRI